MDPTNPEWLKIPQTPETECVRFWVCSGLASSHWERQGQEDSPNHSMPTIRSLSCVFPCHTTRTVREGVGKKKVAERNKTKELISLALPTNQMWLSSQLLPGHTWGGVAKRGCVCLYVLWDCEKRVWPFSTYLMSSAFLPFKTDWLLTHWLDFYLGSG